MSILNNYFTSTVQSLSHRRSSSTAGTQESLTHLPQDRMLYTCIHKSDNTDINIQLKWNTFMNWKIPHRNFSVWLQAKSASSHIQNSTHNTYSTQHWLGTSVFLGWDQRTFERSVSTHTVYLNKTADFREFKMQSPMRIERRCDKAIKTALLDTHLVLQEPFCQWWNCLQQMTAATWGGWGGGEVCKKYAHTNKEWLRPSKTKQLTTFHTQCREIEQNTHPYLVRGDTTNHVVGAVQWVGQGVFVRCFMQLLNDTWGQNRKVLLQFALALEIKMNFHNDNAGS